METLLPIAVKSFLVAGVVLLLLKLARNRSASDRSWIAHLGLAAVLLLPVAVLALPALEVEGPAFLTPPAGEAIVTPAPEAAPERPLHLVKRRPRPPRPPFRSRQPRSKPRRWTGLSGLMPHRPRCFSCSP
jgi:peptidoglycan/LPS O-acetylase OafA/YrhL